MYTDLDTKSYERLESFIRHVDDIKTVVTDFDDTIIKGRASYCVKPIMIEEAKKGHVINLVRGVYNGSRIKRAIKKNKDSMKIDNWGNEIFIKTLGKCKINKDRLEEASVEYFNKNKIPGAVSMLKTLNKEYGYDTLIVTGSADVFIKRPAEELNADYIAPEVMYDENDIPTGIKFLYDSGIGRMESVWNELAKKPAKISETLCIGNDRRDWNVANHSCVSVCSPLGDEETRERFDIKLNEERGYLWLNEKLKEFKEDLLEK